MTSPFLIIQHLLETAPNSDSAFAMKIGALMGLKRWPELENSAQERFKRLPNDLLAIRLLASGAAAQGKYADAIELEQRVVSQGKAGPGDYNELAWDALLSGS